MSCGFDHTPRTEGELCPLRPEAICIGAYCTHYDQEPPGRNLTFAGTHRAAIIGPGTRTINISISLNRAERDALDAQVIGRRCLNRGDYLRLLIEADYSGNLLMIDDAFGKICEAVGRGFGGAAAELTAQADQYRLGKSHD